VERTPAPDALSRELDPTELPTLLDEATRSKLCCLEIVTNSSVQDEIQRLRGEKRSSDCLAVKTEPTDSSQGRRGKRALTSVDEDELSFLSARSAKRHLPAAGIAVIDLTGD